MVAMGSAYLGGQLAYSYKIGVDHTKGLNFPKEFRPVMADSDLREGEMRKVEINGSPILLARSGGQVYAMSNVCPHLGGPLNEGKFDGCTVECPWHGSTFSITDGSIVHGPSVHPAPHMDVRVNDGQIEIRLEENKQQEY